MLRLVVVLPLHQLRDGDGFALRDWPLHVTVAPTFVIDADLAEVVSALSPTLAGQPTLTVHAGADEGFGRSGAIPVTVVEPHPDLTLLHTRLVTALLGVGAEFDDPEFVGAGYRAHVTKTRTSQVRPGEDMELRQAIIVDMAPEGDARLRRVVWSQLLEVP